MEPATSTESREFNSTLNSRLWRACGGVRMLSPRLRMCLCLPRARLVLDCVYVYMLRCLSHRSWVSKCANNFALSKAVIVQLNWLIKWNAMSWSLLCGSIWHIRNMVLIPVREMEVIVTHSPQVKLCGYAMGPHYIHYAELSPTINPFQLANLPSKCAHEEKISPKPSYLPPQTFFQTTLIYTDSRTD